MYAIFHNFFSRIRLAFFLSFCFTLALHQGVARAQSEALDSLDRKIAQMLLIGFRGMTLHENDPFLRAIQSGRVGNVILFDYDVPTKEYKRNIESPGQVRALTERLRRAASASGSGLALFIGIDQEGGKVNRLKPRYGFPPSVSQQYLGTLNNLDSTRAHAAKTAQTLVENGFNLNFAPSVDLNVNPLNPVIGKVERSFSADPALVAAHAAAVTSEHRKRGVVSTLKHFPGHGSSKADSHLGFVDVSDSWKSEELQPYKDLIAAGEADMIMTAHIFNARLDSAYPATLSRRIVTGLLRDSLRYDGVVISDDMQMGAIADHYGLESALELCINAGVDIVCFGNNLIYDPDIPRKAAAIIKRLVVEGKIPMQRIDESYRRIVALKRKLRS
jgi:beta-N-acetylhexosaminidase